MYQSAKLYILTLLRTSSSVSILHLQGKPHTDKSSLWRSCFYGSGIHNLGKRWSRGLPTSAWPYRWSQNMDKGRMPIVVEQGKRITHSHWRILIETEKFTPWPKGHQGRAYRKSDSEYAYPKEVGYRYLRLLDCLVLHHCFLRCLIPPADCSIRIFSYLAWDKCNVKSK